MKVAQGLIGAWNRATFPNASDDDFAAKLAEEVAEAVAEKRSHRLAEELADVVIVAMSWADRAGIDLEREVMSKMGTNQARSLHGRWNKE